jgi:hypothetical protein
MPGRDGTGPMSSGARSGKGLGICTGNDAGVGMGIGYGCRRGFGRYYDEESIGLTDKEILTKQKELLQKRLDLVSKQLENLTEDIKQQGYVPVTNILE